MHPKPLIVMALESEGQGLLEPMGYELLYCGVGKINAAYHLTRRLALAEAQGRPVPWVLNIGSAGSRAFARGALVAADRFVQHDMDATGIGFAHGETPFDAMLPLIQVPRRFTALPHGICGSGDRFVQGDTAVACEIVDMEAYALAKVAQQESVPFACVKYITDGADGGAGVDWQENLKRAAQAFVTLLKEHAA